MERDAKEMKTLFLTNEYPPNIYGGAGVHVDYLSRELAKLMAVEVRCFGDQNSLGTNPEVRGFELKTSDYTCPKPLSLRLRRGPAFVLISTPPKSTPTSCIAIPGTVISAEFWPN